MPAPITLSEETLGSFVLCDARLLGIAWEEAGRDVALRFMLGDGRSVTLRCCRVSSVRISLDYKPNQGGYALSWESRFERRGSRWSFLFDCPPQGSIDLECDGARLDHDAG